MNDNVIDFHAAKNQKAAEATPAHGDDGPILANWFIGFKDGSETTIENVSIFPSPDYLFFIDAKNTIELIVASSVINFVKRLEPQVAENG